MCLPVQYNIGLANLVPRSLADEAEGEIWPNAIWTTWPPVRNVTGEASAHAQHKFGAVKAYLHGTTLPHTTSLRHDLGIFDRVSTLLNFVAFTKPNKHKMRLKGFFYNLAGFVFEYFCDSRRILATFAKFCLNSLFATWSYRFTRHPARARSSSPPSPTQVFWRKKFLQNPPPSANLLSPNLAKTLLVLAPNILLFVRRLGDLVSAKKKLRTGGGVCKVSLCQKSMCVRWRGAWARAGWRVWDLGNGLIMLQKLFNPEWQITSKSFLLSSFLISFSFSPTAEISR